MSSYIIMFLNGDYKMNTSKGKTIQYKRRYNIYIGLGPHKRKTRAPEDWLRELGQQDLLRETNSKRVNSGRLLAPGIRSLLRKLLKILQVLSCWVHLVVPMLRT